MRKMSFLDSRPYRLTGITKPDVVYIRGSMPARLKATQLILRQAHQLSSSLSQHPAPLPCQSQKSFL